VQGIADSISQAHEDLQPGAIHLATGTVKSAGANRSVTAYLANPEAERARYETDTDEGMTLLKFTDASGDIGMANWFASHPTAMTFFNRLISGDHKGRASALFEADHGAGFVGAFAQSNAGDVTPNLNLNNTGPGKDDFESTDIIAHRQFEVARDIFGSAAETLTGPIDYRHVYVDIGHLEVADEFTGAGPQRTCPSAYGYAFAAGSTEDGGGHPLFKEGMLARNAMIDGTVKTQFGLPEPSDACRECQAPKVILFAPGEMDPPGQSQIIPMTLARIGQLTLVCVPSEVTTMAGRRLRERIAKELGTESTHVVLVGYANDYAGYVTTRQEYNTQQYEGGHTLYGPWSLAAYEQEFTRLARAMVSGETPAEGSAPVDMRGKIEGNQLAVGPDAVPGNAAFGEETGKVRKAYDRGESVEAAFWSGNPRNDYHTGGNYLRIERQDGGAWTTVATDNDWSTKCRWLPAPELQDAMLLFASWDIPADATPGTYRVVHEGNYKTPDGTVERFTGVSREFKVK
jgi:neutral ceramidase